MATFPRFVRVVLFVAAVNPVLFGEDWKKGDRVVVSTKADLRVPAKTVGSVPEGTVLEVRQVNGKWLWVKHSESGWIDESFVVSLDALTMRLNEDGDKAVEAEEYDNARIVFERVLKLDPTNAHALLHHADTYFSEGKDEEAIAGFDRAMAVDTLNATIYYWRGDAWRNSKNYQKAVEDYTRAIELSPENGWVFAERGTALTKAGKPNRAIVDYTIALRLVNATASRSKIHYQRGHAWLELADFKTAAADYSMAARLEPENSTYSLKASQILATCPDSGVRDGNLAVKYALKACDVKNYEEAEPLAALAAAYAEAGQFAVAVSMQQKAIELAEEQSGGEYQVRLNLYESNKPYRDKAFSKTKQLAEKR